MALGNLQLTLPGAACRGMAYFTLNMWNPAAGERAPVGGLEVIADMSSANMSSDISTATSLAASGPLLPPAARQCAASAPALTTGIATPPAPANTPEVSSLSGSDMSVYRSKSSPFVKDGLTWADKLAKDADHLAASISVASAVHSPEPPMHSASSVRRSGSSLRRRMCPPVSAAHHAMLTPRLSAHTSMLLKATLNPLEDALSEELANSDLPILFLHGVGGLPAYLEMLLQVRHTPPNTYFMLLDFAHSSWHYL